MERNLLNFSKEQIDKPIFRFLSTNRLFELFEKHKNTLVSPKLWEDPFENHIMCITTELKREDEKGSCIGFRDNFFGQCWTQTRESDAMWRIYSPNKNGVRITTTPRKLLKSLYEDTGCQINDYSCFLGKVKYYKTPKLKEFLNLNSAEWVYFDPTGQGLAQSLLFKRTPFKHENEVRLLFNSKFKGEKNPDFYSYYFDPREIIDDIVFDPRMDVSEFNRHKKNLIQLRFEKRIVKSRLYDIPKFIIETQF
jgi:hypothetical protein